MAKLDFVLQAVTKANHAAFVRKLLEIESPTGVLISVAFARTSGLEAIRKSIEPVASRTRVFVGIRNDITSIQAIKELLALKLDVYAVDTGSRQTIFHPKLYMAMNATTAVSIVGSANMTFSGLYNNIEVSTRMVLDLQDPADKSFVNSVTDAFDFMLAEHPDHAFKIHSAKQANLLFEEGRLADEDVIVAPAVGSKTKKGAQDSLPRMKLARVPPPQAGKLKTAKSGKPSGAAVPTVVAAPPTGVKYLVWESKPLTQRDLSIPKGSNTNPTGSMGLKKGLYEGIDQRHYFYDKVFFDLAWSPDRPGSTTLRATARMELVVKNVSYGVYDLLLSHKTDTKSATYKQKNFMTQLHWGVAKPVIARTDLLGRKLSLYRKDGSPPEFTIEID